MWAKKRRKRLQKYVRRYFKKYPDIKLVLVTGSIGKTQAKIAIATVLSERFRVRLFQGNRGSHFTTPLAILGIDYPEKDRSVFAWHKVFKAARQRLKQAQDVDVIIHELNATHLGSLAKYAKYLQADVSVVTAVSESNIREFQSIDQVAREQLSIGEMSQSMLINRDDIDSKFAEYVTTPNISTYGIDGSAEFSFEESDYSTDSGYSGAITIPNRDPIKEVVIPIHDEFTLRQTVAAGAIAAKLGMSADEIRQGSAKVTPLTGHMNIFKGYDDSIILDDTANNSPLGARTALRSLYNIQSPQRVAVLGSMRRLGQFSQAAHREIGSICDPSQLAWVVTVGDEANKWLAPAARGRGCQVKECQTALEAGGFVNGVIERESAILFNGHEDDFIEEGIKIILKNDADSQYLIRQEPSFMDKKMDAFSLYR